MSANIATSLVVERPRLHVKDISHERVASNTLSWMSRSRSHSPAGRRSIAVSSPRRIAIGPSRTSVRRSDRPKRHRINRLRCRRTDARKRKEKRLAGRHNSSGKPSCQSLGGILAKRIVQGSGTRYWRLVGDLAAEDLSGLVATCCGALVFEPRPEVRRVVFVATSLRGSRVRPGVSSRDSARRSSTPTRPAPGLTNGLSPARAPTIFPGASGRVTDRYRRT